MEFILHGLYLGIFPDLKIKTKGLGEPPQWRDSEI
jgi:hypothetical protein